MPVSVRFNFVLTQNSHQSCSNQLPRPRPLEPRRPFCDMIPGGPRRVVRACRWLPIASKYGQSWLTNPSLLKCRTPIGREKDAASRFRSTHGSPKVVFGVNAPGVSFSPRRHVQNRQNGVSPVSNLVCCLLFPPKSSNWGFRRPRLGLLPSILSSDVV